MPSPAWLTLTGAMTNGCVLKVKPSLMLRTETGT